MRVIALIADPGVIRRILEHLGLWVPEATEPGPRPHTPNAVIRYGLCRSPQKPRSPRIRVSPLGRIRPFGSI